jgi:response regulator of citrate/malate metabolism
MWTPRSRERLPQGIWEATLRRVRSEFEEMPCLQVTLEQARALFGLPGVTCEWVLQSLLSEGFLLRTAHGAYRRRRVEA